MTQVTNYAVANGPRAEVRLNFNAVLAALRDDNAGPTPPPNPVPFMIWKDTSGGGEGVYRVMNAAGSAWILLIDALQPDKIAALESLATGSALRQLTRAHWSQSVVMSLGGNDWRGAADVNNTVFYPASQTVNGITSTIEGRGYFADGTPFWDVRVAGTVAGGGSSVSVAYLSAAGLIPLPAAQRTASAIIRKTGGTGAVSLRVAMTEVGGTNAGTTNGNSVNASTDTVSSATRITGGGSVRCGIGWVAAAGTVLNDTFRISGPQLELGPVRTNLSFREVGLFEAARAMGVGRQLIRTVPCAGVAGVDFTAADFADFGGNFSHVEFILDNVCVPGSSLALRLSSDGGATFSAGASDYKWSLGVTNSAPNIGNLGANSAAQIALHFAQINAGDGLSGKVEIFGCNRAISQKVAFNTSQFRADSFFENNYGGGMRTSAAVTNGARFFAASGSMTGGFISMYGVRA